jgi:hypothetical protein
MTHARTSGVKPAKGWTVERVGFSFWGKKAWQHFNYFSATVRDTAKLLNGANRCGGLLTLQ